MPPTPLFIEPDWPAPDSVLALSTTRLGGCSEPPYDRFNLGHHVGDCDDSVVKNRALLAASLPTGVELSWLSQVHGTRVLEAGALNTDRSDTNQSDTNRSEEGCCGPYPEADAQWSRCPGVACVTMTADCLPVLFCSTGGDIVASAHAGWRGLLAGVLETTVGVMNTSSDQVLAWLGPAIGPTAFEVGAEVREAFLASTKLHQVSAVDACFTANPTHSGYWFGDLYALARIRLGALGVTRVFGGDFCTHSDSERFFSYRRDGQTGRMASLILLR